MLMSKAELDECFYKWLQPELAEGMTLRTFRYLMSRSREEKARVLCVKFNIPINPNETTCDIRFYVATSITEGEPNGI